MERDIWKFCFFLTYQQINDKENHAKRLNSAKQLMKL